MSFGRVPGWNGGQILGEGESRTWVLGEKQEAEPALGVGTGPRLWGGQSKA